MDFVVIPALDLKDGKCVQLVQGDPTRMLLSVDDPVGVALKWQETGAPRLHLIDLDGAIEGIRKNEGIVKEIISKMEIPVQFGGGLRSINDARSVLELGASRVILGTLAFERPDDVRELSGEFGRNRITIALDSKGGTVVTKGWTYDTKIKPWDAVKNFEDIASEILFTNVDVEGLMGGIEDPIIRKLIDSTDLGIIVSGGISTHGDVKKIAALKAQGVVIGSALYTKKIDLKEAIKSTS